MEGTITFRRPVSIAGYETKSAYGEIQDRPMDNEWKITPMWVSTEVEAAVQVHGHRVYVPYGNVDGVDFS